MYTIVLYPDERLRQATSEIKTFDFVLRDKAIGMIKTMISNGGAGLSAPQVGISQSFFVTQDKLLNHQIIINPKWTKSKDAVAYLAEEGCLSFPGLFIKVERFDKIDVQYQYVDGKIYEDTLDGFAAHVFQHESDHLLGVVMIDHLKM